MVSHGGWSLIAPFERLAETATVLIGRGLAGISSCMTTWSIEVAMALNVCLGISLHSPFHPVI